MEASLVYLASSRLVMTTEQDPVLRKKREKKVGKKGRKERE